MTDQTQIAEITTESISEWIEIVSISFESIMSWQMSNVKSQMSKVKCQINIKLMSNVKFISLNGIIRTPYNLTVWCQKRVSLEELHLPKNRSRHYLEIKGGWEVIGGDLSSRERASDCQVARGGLQTGVYPPLSHCQDATSASAILHTTCYLFTLPNSPWRSQLYQWSLLGGWVPLQNLDIKSET